MVVGPQENPTDCSWRWLVDADHQSPTLNQISALETLARNCDWSLLDAGIGARVDLSLSHHDIVESLKTSHSSTPKS
jgi:hypothetical protein